VRCAARASSTIDTLAAMDEQERAREIARLWPRLREEAHELYREVGTLRGRIRQLEREVAGSQRSAENLRAANEKLSTSLNDVRVRLRAIERSKGWRLIIKVRRVLRRPRPAPVPKETSAMTPRSPITTPPEPTFAQRRAAEAMHRSDVAAALDRWIESARAAPGDVVVVVTGDRLAAQTEAMIQEAFSAGDPVCLLERDPESGIGGIPPGITPSLVPDLLAMDAGGKERLLVCTTPGHAAIRWIVPAQQAGWSTVLVTSDHQPSAAFTYLASVVDAVVVPDGAAARAAEAATGVRATVRANASPRDALAIARAAPPALTRVVLGID